MKIRRSRPKSRYLPFAILVIVAFLAGCCMPSAEAQPAVPECSVICTVYPVYLIARELASGTGLSIGMLLPAELGCPHNYSLTPADVAGLEKSKLILANGLGFEPFLERLADSGFGNRIVRIATATLAMASHEGEPPNPHLFTTPAGLSGMVDAAAKALSGVVPPGTAGTMQANASRLRSHMNEIKQEWATMASSLQGLPVVITHNSLDYICSAMNFSIVARLETDDEHQHSAHSRLEIEHAIRAERPVAILTDNVAQPDEIIALGREHGIPVIALPTLTAGSSTSSPDPLGSAMRAVITALAPLAPAFAPSQIPLSPTGK